MFKCQKCGKVSQSGEKQFTLIQSRRSKIYRYMTSKNRDTQKKTLVEQRDAEEHQSHTVVKHGWEIVIELKVCHNCSLQQGEPHETTARN